MHALSWLRGVVYCVCHGSAQPELSLSLAQPIPRDPRAQGMGVCGNARTVGSASGEVRKVICMLAWPMRGDCPM